MSNQAYTPVPQDSMYHAAPQAPPSQYAPPVAQGPNTPQTFQQGVQMAPVNPHMHIRHDMKTQSPFTNGSGIIVRQETQSLEFIAQAVGIPFEAKNRYRVMGLPQGRQVSTGDWDPNTWNPSHVELATMPPYMLALEESDCMTRCMLAMFGGLNLRSLQMHVGLPGYQDSMIIDRPCKMGAMLCCCCPNLCALRMNAYDVSGQQVRLMGQVQEDCDCQKWIACCCCCQVNHKILAMPQQQHLQAPGAQIMEVTRDLERQMEHRYSVKADMCCCGRHNNCCGGTCCKTNQFFDVNDLHGNPVANIQRTYAAGGSGLDSGCCRMMNKTNNFMMSFPQNATPDDKKLLMTAIFQLDYQMFEHKGGDKK